MNRGVPPFTGGIDEWPADRAYWLDVVMTVEEQVINQQHRDREADQQHEQWKASRERRS